MIALFVLAAMLATGSDQASPAPGPTPNTADVIPEIGRVKSKAPPCIVLKDLVAPSFAAAMQADKQYAQAAPQFAAYAAAKDAARTLPANARGAQPFQPDDSGQTTGSRMTAADTDSATPEMYLARLDTALAAMKQNVLTISKALGDPRLAPDSANPVIRSERDELLRLYIVQASRVATLGEFIERQRMSLARSDRTITNNTTFDSKTVRFEDLAAQAAAALDSGHVPLLAGQPNINGMAANDKQAMTDWTGGMGRSVRDNENLAAKAFYDISQNCLSL